MLSNATITNGFFHLTATEQRDKKFFIYVLLLSVVVIPELYRAVPPESWYTLYTYAWYSIRYLKR